MTKYGIHGTMNAWFTSYLSLRSLKVKCNVASSNETVYSVKKEVNIGTP